MSLGVPVPAQHFHSFYVVAKFYISVLEQGHHVETEKVALIHSKQNDSYN